MSNEKRGSEKLLASCTGTQTLSPEELEQVAGGASSIIWKAFPHGMPWPEIFYAGPQVSVFKQPAVQLDQGIVNGIGENLKQPGALYRG